MENKEVKDEKKYGVVEEITSTRRLMDAFANVYTLQDGIMDEISSEFTDELKGMLEQQKKVIEDYIGVFDYEIFKGNINYLLKKYNLKISDMESYLGISPGYISRAFNESSNKRLSIDIVWKIAKMFGTDIRTLVNTKMWEIKTNTELLTDFINRLIDDTKSNRISWIEDGGGKMRTIASRYVTTQLSSVERNEQNRYPYYGFDGIFDTDTEYVITNDIEYIEKFDGNMDLAVIPYARKQYTDTEGYDFVLISNTESEKYNYERLFSTDDDVLATLDPVGQELYDAILYSGLDVKLTSNVKNIITKYIDGGK